MTLKPGDPRRSRTYEALRRDFLAPQPQPCWWCDEPINYHAPPRSPLSPTIDHEFEVDAYPELALVTDYWRAAHARCNSERGARYRNDKHATRTRTTIDPGPSRHW